MIHKEDFSCPKCDKEHNVSFEYYRPDDKDRFNNIVNCECGIKFVCVIEAEVRTEFVAYQAEIIQ